MGSHEVARRITNIGAILFYFTKSDIKTTVIPISVFAAAAAPPDSVSRFLQVVFWIWVHLLQFDVSNQTLDQEEDASNKADRPIPSGRISFHQALVFRWLLVPICFGLSAPYGPMTLFASVSLVFFTVLYNELHAHAGHWLTRNTVNACGFMSFELGATLISGSSPTCTSTATLAIMLSGGIFATTIHAQDFKDTEGDRKIGRRTIPIVMPAVARLTVLLPLLVWSISLAKVWELEGQATLAFISLALLVGVRYLLYRSRDGDQYSFYYYNVWLSVAHALPAYYRLKLSSHS